MKSLYLPRECVCLFLIPNKICSVLGEVLIFVHGVFHEVYMMLFSVYVGVGWGMTGKCLYPFLKVFSDLFIPLATDFNGYD